MTHIPITILGATGVVGQKLIALLEDHPQFMVTELVASAARAGKLYGQTCQWHEPLMPLPERISKMEMIEISDITTDYVVSCLPGKIAKKIEPQLASEGKIIFSNASVFRMDANIPLIIPEINAQTLAFAGRQPTTGKIIKNPNCSAAGIALALAPLMSLDQIVNLNIVTLQSISGAGYPGLSALDFMANTIPHIDGEAEKISQELKKILSTEHRPIRFPIHTQVHRVPVAYGHSASLTVTFSQPITPAQAHQTYHDWNARYPNLFSLYSQLGCPQPRQHLQHDDMRIHIGHLSQLDDAYTLGLVTLSHNLVRGAAGGVIANMQAYQQHHAPLTVAGCVS